MIKKEKHNSRHCEAQLKQSMPNAPQLSTLMDRRSGKSSFAMTDLLVSYKTKLLLLLILLALPGCNTLNERYMSSSKPNEYFTMDSKPYHPETIFCYQSLADVECFKTPQYGREEQLVNYVDKEPTPSNKPIDLYAR